LAVDAAAVRAPAVARAPRFGGFLVGGVVVGYLSLVVLLPIAAIAARAGNFENAVTNREAVAALKLTLVLSLIVALVNAVVGTATAWVLVRDDFRGKRFLNAVIDLPFALPTIVAGLTLLALYGPNGASGINLAYTRAGVLLALLFVTLPFVVRAVQPVLLELDRDMEEAAASLGARPVGIFRRIVFPNLLPAILSGVALAFARAVGEFGAIVLISGNLPFKTELSSVYIFGRLQSQDAAGAASLSLVMLVISFAVLLGVGGLRRWATRHDRAA
jgi:sulfate/thiosulfate transport system permease protein